MLCMVLKMKVLFLIPQYMISKSTKSLFSIQFVITLTSFFSYIILLSTRMSLYLNQEIHINDFIAKTRQSLWSQWKDMVINEFNNIDHADVQDKRKIFYLTAVNSIMNSILPKLTNISEIDRSWEQDQEQDIYADECAQIEITHMDEIRYQQMRKIKEEIERQKALIIIYSNELIFNLRNKEETIKLSRDLALIDKKYSSLCDKTVLIQLGQLKQIQDWKNILVQLLESLTIIKGIRIQIKGVGKDQADQSLVTLFQGLASFTEIIQLSFQDINFNQHRAKLYASKEMQKIIGAIFSNNLELTQISILKCRNFPLFRDVTSLQSMLTQETSFLQKVDFVCEAIRTNKILRSITYFRVDEGRCLNLISYMTRLIYSSHIDKENLINKLQSIFPRVFRNQLQQKDLLKRLQEIASQRTINYDRFFDEQIPQIIIQRAVQDSQDEQIKLLRFILDEIGQKDINLLSMSEMKSIWVKFISLAKDSQNFDLAIKCFQQYYSMIYDQDQKAIVKIQETLFYKHLNNPKYLLQLIALIELSQSKYSSPQQKSIFNSNESMNRFIVEQQSQQRYFGVQYSLSQQFQSQIPIISVIHQELQVNEDRDDMIVNLLRINIEKDDNIVNNHKQGGIKLLLQLYKELINKKQYLNQMIEQIAAKIQQLGQQQHLAGIDSQLSSEQTEQSLSISQFLRNQWLGETKADSSAESQSNQSSQSIDHLRNLIQNNRFSNQQSQIQDLSINTVHMQNQGEIDEISVINQDYIEMDLFSRFARLKNNNHLKIIQYIQENNNKIISERICHIPQHQIIYKSKQGFKFAIKKGFTHYQWFGSLNKALFLLLVRDIFKGLQELKRMGILHLTFSFSDLILCVNQANYDYSTFTIESIMDSFDRLSFKFISYENSLFLRNESSSEQITAQLLQLGLLLYNNRQDRFNDEILFQVIDFIQKYTSKGEDYMPRLDCYCKRQRDLLIIDLIKRLGDGIDWDFDDLLRILQQGVQEGDYEQIIRYIDQLIPKYR